MFVCLTHLEYSYSVMYYSQVGRTKTQARVTKSREGIFKGIKLFLSELYQTPKCVYTVLV